MRTERHFTLIEIIVIFAILSLIATLTGTVLFSVQQSWSKIKENTALLEDMVKLDRIANNVFRNAIPFHWPDENNKNKQIFKGRSDFLRVAYLHRINSEHENGIRFIELFLHENKLVAKYRDYPMTEENPEHCTEEVLISNVQKLEFRYAERSKNEIVWNSEFDEVDAENIPLAIRMTITFEDGETVDFLRRTAGNSFVSTYGAYNEKKK